MDTVKHVAGIAPGAYILGNCQMITYWDNLLIVMHSNDSKVRDVVAAYREKRLLSYLCPEPFKNDMYLADNLHSEAPSADGPSPKESTDELPIWYRWRMDNWGTPFEISATNSIDIDQINPRICRHEGRGVSEARLAFRTLWAPPLSAYRSAVLAHGLILRTRYSENTLRVVGQYESDNDVERLGIA